MSEPVGNLRVRFWGTRGSIASPGAGTLKYGGNTACVELDLGGTRVIPEDLGTTFDKIRSVLEAKENE